MLEWILGCYAVLSLVIIWRAAVVAITVPDAERRRDAYKVLKLMMGALTGTGGLIALLVKLHDLGVL